MDHPLRSQLRGGEVERRLGLDIGLGLDVGLAAGVHDDVLDVLGVLPHVRAPRHLRLQPRLAQLAGELGGTGRFQFQNVHMYSHGVWTRLRGLARVTEKEFTQPSPYFQSRVIECEIWNIFEGE